MFKASDFHNLGEEPFAMVAAAQHLQALATGAVVRNRLLEIER